MGFCLYQPWQNIKKYSSTQSYSWDFVYTSPGRISRSIVLRSVILHDSVYTSRDKYQVVQFYTVLFTGFCLHQPCQNIKQNSSTQLYSRDSVYTSRERISSSIVLGSLIHGILTILAQVEYQGAVLFTGFLLYQPRQNIKQYCSIRSLIYGILSIVVEVEYQVVSFYPVLFMAFCRCRISSSIALYTC